MSDFVKDVPYTNFDFSKRSDEPSKKVKSVKPVKPAKSVRKTFEKKSKSKQINELKKKAKSASFTRKGNSHENRNAQSMNTTQKIRPYPFGQSIIFREDNKIRKHLSINLPKHPIILITTHGEICTSNNSKNKSVEFFIPDSFLSVQKINFSPQGIVTLMSALSLRAVGHVIKTNRVDSLEQLRENTDLHKYLTIIKHLEQSYNYHGLRIGDTPHKHIIDQFVMKLTHILRTSYRDRVQSRYFRHEEVVSTLDSTVNLHKYESISGQYKIDEIKNLALKQIFIHEMDGRRKKLLMRNKTFITADTKIERAADPYIFSVTVLNMNDGIPFDLLPGLFMSLNRPSIGDSLEFTTKELLTYLSIIVDDKNQPKVSIPILLDTSCSIHDNDNPSLDDSLKVKKTGYGGKNKKI